MKLQEIYDQSVSGVLQQGDRSTSYTGMCALRGTSGKKCAVGHLIADEDYIASMEDDSFMNDFEDFPIGKRVEQFKAEKAKFAEALEKTIGEIDVIKLDLLSKLQAAHDDNIEIKEMADDFSRVAKKFNLSNAVVTKHQKEGD